MQVTIVVALNAHGEHTNVLHEVRRELVARALEIASGNITEAAELLGVHRQSLQRTMIKLGLTDRRRDLHVTPVQ